MKSVNHFIILFLCSFLAIGAYGQEKQELFLDIDGQLFFRDNEFDSPLMKGYSLPGFRLLADLEYEPSKNINLRGGVWMMHYWGASRYPNCSYIGIPNYAPDNSSHGVHAVPFLSLEMSTPGGLSVILGDIHSRDGHGLLQQIYSPELLLTADPEVGVQLLYSNHWIDVDAWLDWKTFIYNNSPYQENFFVGASTKIKYNSPKSPIHFYSPIQALVEHRGGEIDTLTISSVQTFVNVAAGIGARFKTGHSGLRYVNIEADFLYSWEQAGEIWHKKTGWGVYAQGALEFKNCDVHAGYFLSHDYNTVLGYSLWGVDSRSNPGLVLNNPHTIYAGFKYQREWLKGFSLGAKIDIYQQLACDAYNYSTLEKSHYGSKTNFSFEVTMAFSPSFLLKKIPTKHSHK